MKELFDGEYAIPEGYTASVENCKIIVKKEESDDEKIRKWIINEIKIKHHNLDEANVDFVDKAIAWLEKQSEKGTNRNEREIPNPVWSEEDEYVYNEILKRVTEKKLYEHDLEYIYKWLKLLKERYAWKPSDEQMKLLREVQQALLGKDCHNRFVGFMYELKRLREE